MTSPEKLATPEINHASAETAKVLEHAIGALADILGGWRYIRQSHGDLYGVGWDRCEKSASIAIAALRTEVSRLATGRGWLPIESAPLFTPLDGPIPPCLVYAPGYGVCMGAAGQDKFGHKYAYINSVLGSAGDIVTHFIPIPAAPGATSQGVAVARPDAREAALEQAANLVECEYAHDKTQAQRLAQIAQHIRDLKKRGV